MGIYPNYSKIRGIKFYGYQEKVVYELLLDTDLTPLDIKKAVEFYNSLSEEDKRRTAIQVLVEVSCTYEQHTIPEYMWWLLPNISFITDKTI